MNHAPLPVRASLSEERSRPDASLFRRNAALCNPDRDYRSVENAECNPDRDYRSVENADVPSPASRRGCIPTGCRPSPEHFLFYRAIHSYGMSSLHLIMNNE
ncbi:MAG: hypothetical protein LBS09_04460 [Bacteroidales bacterium]|nr:hypothetical protein [Bacteroidales bacterium]